MSTKETLEAIALLNDHTRQSLRVEGNRLVTDFGPVQMIGRLASTFVEHEDPIGLLHELIESVRCYDFSDNRQALCVERDTGVVRLNYERVVFQIAYYEATDVMNEQLTHYASDPSSRERTTRVLYLFYLGDCV